METCNHCGKSNKNTNSNTQHQLRCKENPNKIKYFKVWELNGAKGKIPWSKGLNKDNDPRIRKISEKLKTKKGESNPFYNKKHTAESKAKIGEKLSISNKGGICKWYDCSNNNKITFKAQGTWELEFTKYLNTIDDNWIKIGIGYKDHTFKWIDDFGISHRYTPDFWSPKLKIYFEIKGYWRDKDKTKMQKVLEQNDINLEIVNGEKLKKYLEMVP